MRAVVLCCPGAIEPERQIEWGRTVYRCPDCRLSLALKDDRLAGVFARVEAAGVEEISLAALCAGQQRLSKNSGGA